MIFSFFEYLRKWFNFFLSILSTRGTLLFQIIFGITGYISDWCLCKVSIWNFKVFSLFSPLMLRECLSSWATPVTVFSLGVIFKHKLSVWAQLTPQGFRGWLMEQVAPRYLIYTSGSIKMTNDIYLPKKTIWLHFVLIIWVIHKYPTFLGLD